jgi:hypothetical protein
MVSISDFSSDFDIGKLAAARDDASQPCNLERALCSGNALR